MEKDLEDIHWVDEVLKGKTENFAQVVDKYKDKIFSLAMGMLKHKEEAEEATQDVFVKIFKALPKFQHKAKFSTWIYRIAYNECISRLRKHKVQTISVEDNFTNNLIAAEEKEEGWQETEIRSHLLHKALDGLPEIERGLVHFFYFENLSVEEITRISGLSVSNVKIKLFRIRKKLFTQLHPLKSTVLT